MTDPFAIAGRAIGPGHPPYVIAELSGNHNGELSRAFALMEAARDAGAHAIKIQTYTADTITIDCDRPEFKISGGLWDGRTLYDLYREAHTPWDWHPALFDKARDLGVTLFSTPFDLTAVDFLEGLGAPAYKIASFELTHRPLLRAVGATGKPVILSTGMATLAEIEEAMTTLRQSGCNQVALLKCTSSYPASPVDSNLHTIPYLRTIFGCEAGLSDHTLGSGVAVAAVALGATVIEKHFTMNRAEGGVDSAFSLEPSELRELVDESERAWQALGTVRFGPTAAEEGSVQFRQTIFASRDIAAGEVLSADNIRIARPGYGLAPKHYEGLLGLTAACAIQRGTPMQWSLVSNPND